TWRVAAIGGGDAQTDAAAITRFNQAQRGRAAVDSIAAVTPTPQVVAARVAASAGLTCFCELDPASAGFAAAADAVRACGARAKLRTGGIVATAIPPLAAVAAFLHCCHELGLSFKATAGLHHAIRGEYPLTYAAGAAKAVMHGYLNLALAAALVRAGGSPEASQDILEREHAAELRVEPDAILWKSTRWKQEQIVEGRRFFRGFGSCSFEEPLQWLTSL
ncbi:MAG: hypothetical protein ACRDOE_26340, partial [Streptosporangiaceae bacterium]